MPIYRVDAKSNDRSSAPAEPYVPNRFLLRLHGLGYQTSATLHSECLWLQALREEAQLLAPAPVKTLDGQWCMAISAPGAPSPRWCTLMRWMSGRHRRRALNPNHVTQIGRLMGRLHEHARQWRPPATFERRQWDWDGLFGPQSAFGAGWAFLPEPYYTQMRRVVEELAETMRRLGRGPEVFGLIHADLGLGNILFRGGEARAIDFDDCGFGYWLYDIAITLRRWRWMPEWPVFRQAFLTGYTERQPAPAELLRHLDAFMAGRHVAVALWTVGKAQTHSRLRRDLTVWLETVARDIAQYNQVRR